MIVAGVDEAGYGPLLGPLVVSASAFRVREPAAETAGSSSHDLWSALAAAVCRKPDGVRIAVDDSKKLFNQKKGVCNLEEGVLSFLQATGRPLPRDLRALVRAVATAEPLTPGQSGGEDAYLDAYPWYCGKNAAVPQETFPGVVAGRAARLREALAASGIELLGLWSRPVEVVELNEGIAETDSKAQVSFRAVGGFLGRLWELHPREAVEVIVDRQGGRAHYAPALFERLQPLSIRIDTQTEALSAYTLRRRGSPFPDGFRVSFATDSETLSLPVALASMLSKYVRELHMLLFNEFWRQRRPTLKPTAGYAVDARRFLEEIVPLRRDLGIEDRMLIRCR